MLLATRRMHPIDWIIVFVYLVGIVALSIWIGARQKQQSDYYLAGNRLGPWSIAGSMIATQCSAISLIGAPAFIALKEGGGLKWLQYELAVPLAAIGILYLVSGYKKPNATTIFYAVEGRMGVGTRKVLSLLFIAGRGLATGVALYAMSVVVAVCLDLSVASSILIVGGLSLIYTTIGGIEADIYSDILQLLILWLSALACGIVLLFLIESPGEALGAFDPERLSIYQLSGNGLNDGASYSLWPMLIGGFFLYLAYYGCDQSQAQRLLAARDLSTARKAILLNGTLRLPLVLTYCGFGVLLGLFFQQSPWLQNQMIGQNPDFIAPYFIIEYMPIGLKGIIVSGILAAAMSSLDSNINSLSASLEKDFLDGRKIPLPGFREPLQRARSLTVLFGLAACGLAFLFSGSQATVLVLVNAISSAFNGPILACFVFILLKRSLRNPAWGMSSLLAGIATNATLWQAMPQMSWLWWNLFGFLVAMGGLIIGSTGDKASSETRYREAPKKSYLYLLGVVALATFAILLGLHTVLQ
ncbi:hypothetical protein [Pelagicoccus sp. SDUM812002]|uniref:sodium:solute symporter family transporter n=1 Tax=Pelagicoccus sp. SDUM812002 TaxID=3041266 RepID=UPI0028108B87|nr:hypothetical protein [Pelagicoccus sp. SDUM812002]MDQ8188281.1 hypothetical protein [Pelagicoccus sp. SDUM812002]